ncbi:MAG: carboxypeptidase-like regulatory domain-containing protein [Janthinobacterium lividum]
MDKAPQLIGWLLLLPVASAAQTINGSVTNAAGEPLPAATVLVTDSAAAGVRTYYAPLQNGRYALKLTGAHRRVTLLTEAPGYLPESFEVVRPGPDKAYRHDFRLPKQTTVELGEVTVKAKLPPFRVSEDTVAYRVAAYADGSERKIQEVLRKMPGIEVNDKTGAIKYKGKPVEAVKLDGADLFADNYSIGTKNINSYVVKEVQAIEHYSANPLLKGIEHSERVALNLVLEKQTSYSGSLNAALGPMRPATLATALDASLIGLSPAMKSFGTATYNNIGENNSPFDYFANNPNPEQLKEAPLLATRYLPDTYFNSFLDSRRLNLNHALFSSYNAVFKAGPRVDVKTNVYYFTDRISALQRYSTTNVVEGQHFTTTDQYETRKTPRQLRGDLEVKYSPTPRSLLEYTARYRTEQVGTEADILQNDSTAYHSRLTTHENLYAQTLAWTWKMRENQALQVIAQQSANAVPQQLAFMPAVYLPLDFTANRQQSEFRKNYSSLKAVLLRGAAKNKFQATLGIKAVQNYFTSSLYGVSSGGEQSVAGFQNDFAYAATTPYASASYNRQLGRWRLGSGLTATYLSQQLTGPTLPETSRQGRLLLEPNLSLGLKVLENATVSVSGGYRQQPFSEEYLVANPVIASNRLIKSSEVGLYLQRTYSANAFFLLNDLEKLLRISVGGGWSAGYGNYFSELLITPTTTQTRSFFLPEPATLWTASALLEKYVPALQSTVRVSSDYSASTYRNIVNRSGLRDNRSDALSSILFMKTALDWKINFENQLEHRLIASRAADNPRLFNQSFFNSTKLIFKPNRRILLTVAGDYYVPNASSPKTNFFLDAYLRLITPKKDYSFSVSAKNITNSRFFEQLDANDYSISRMQANLLPAYVLVSAERSF